MFFEPVRLDSGAWCDSGIVDIFPVRPVLDIEDPFEVALAVNCFYPPEFAGEDATGWDDSAASILYVASTAGARGSIRASGSKGAGGCWLTGAL